MLSAVVILALLLVGGLLYQWAGTERDAKRYPPPGRRIEINGTLMHVLLAGRGMPAVVFEAGIAASSASWRPVQEAIAQTTTTVAYDRAGLAWSARAAHGLTVAEMIDALRELLTRAALQPPYVLVGHSFGALLVRLYADQWPQEVSGLVLIDPALTLEWANPDSQRLKMLGRGIALSRRGAWLARIGIVRLALAMLASGGRFLPKLISHLSSGKGHSVSERLVGEVRKLPPELWPAVQSHWCRPESFESMARHLEALPGTAAEVFKTKPLGPIPVTVISADRLTPEQVAEHRAIAASSDHGRHLIATESGHWVHLDQPELVIAAIRDMVSRYG
jgi:pimeloyl-ACP methyl ester carboxylesterase